MFIVALRWLNRGESDSAENILSHSNATTVNSFGGPKKIVDSEPLLKMRGDHVEPISQLVSEPEIVFEPEPEPEVDVMDVPVAMEISQYAATSALPIDEEASNEVVFDSTNVAELFKSSEAEAETQTAEVLTTSATQVRMIERRGAVENSERVEQIIGHDVSAIPASFALTEFSFDLVDNLQSVVESTDLGFAPSEPVINQPAVRLAAVPLKKDKLQFKKFGAKKPKSESKDNEDDQDDDPPTKQPVVLSASNRWKLAGEPKKGDRYKDDTPLTDACSHFIEGAHGNFSPTPTMPEMPYDPCGEMNVYEGKTLYANQRPLLELGRPWYQLGPISEGSSILGFHNHVNPQYLIFGDARSAVASNRANGDSTTLMASQLNLFHHFKFTSTERFVAGMTPLTRGPNNSRYIFDDDEYEFEGNANFNFAYMEGDLGAIAGGAIGQTLPFDLPFAAGIMPLVFQNGIWMEDEILGFAVTIPARNSARFDISNMDITFFAGYDKLNSPAFEGDDSAARVMGIATFLDALNGHFEIDYAFLDDRTNQDRSYHNIGIGYTRRYGRLISNSTRIIVNAGQQSNVPGTADGVLLLSENSLITGHPSTVVPYLNLFAGFDRPQSVGRNGLAGGILRNTGILFETDNLTGYPTLDATANDTFGMAMGLNLLADEFAQQLIVEMAMLGVMGDDANRNAVGDQYGVGVRYQLPLTNSVIFRADAMVGFLRGDEDINGGRMEIRKKF